MNINELMGKKAKLVTAMRTFLDTNANANGCLSGEDDMAYAKMEQELRNVEREMKRIEELEALDRIMSQPQSEPIVGKPEKKIADMKTGRASDEYKVNFWNMVRAKIPSYTVLDALQEGTDSEGGYLVPVEFERTLVQALDDENIFRPMAKVIKTSSGDRKIPMVIDKGQAYWLDEEEAFTESDDTFGQTSLGAHKLGTMIKVSEELLQDAAFDIEAYIRAEFARRMGAAEEAAFFTGDGSGKPLGILAATGGAETGVTAASATAIKADELIDLFHSLRAPYRKNAVWTVNDTTMAQIRKLKDGEGHYLWQPSFTADAPDTILGRPLKTSIFMPEIEAGAKTVVFGDFKYYWIADRAGRTFKKLNELFATTGQVGFLAQQRVDGKLILPEAVKVLKQKSA